MRVWVIESGDPMHGWHVVAVVNDAGRGSAIEQAQVQHVRCYGGRGEWVAEGAGRWRSGGATVKATAYEVAVTVQPWWESMMAQRSRVID